MNLIKFAHPVRLASSSPSRRKILEQTQIPFIAKGVDLDERAIQESREYDSKHLALILAQEKAKLASSQSMDTIVIGCDQTLECDGSTFHKAGDRDKNIEQLLKLQGKIHYLHSAWAIYVNHVGIESGIETVKLKMRSLTKTAVENYVNQEQAFDSCGGYYYESLGKVLFEQVDGSMEGILGLPIHPILNSLFRHDLASFAS